MVVDVILPFEAQATRQRNIRPHAPRVLGVERVVDAVRARNGVAGNDGKLAGAPARGDDLPRRQALRESLGVN
jgi:hypothetical protein